MLRDRSREPEPPLVSPSHNSCLPARLSPSVLDSQGADLLASGVTSVWSGLLCVMAGPGPSHPCFACCSFGVAFGTICGSSYCSPAKDNLETERSVELFEEGKMSNSKEEERESSTERESNVVRIKVVVTKEELRQILGHTKGINSIQRLDHVLKDSGRNISRAYEEDKELSDESWSPTLESFPKNHY
ncbi:hypothetical protein HID58_054178 [Brassica napus]|uniref:Uncharacterized protein n=1 Tax=Brassica napus TaxID=3708 RepID=A0ABQ8AGS6_BRANA|nr:hypothetical protein HID58_054178 [Brassica napus]